MRALEYCGAPILSATDDPKRWCLIQITALKCWSRLLLLSADPEALIYWWWNRCMMNDDLRKNASVVSSVGSLQTKGMIRVDLNHANSGFPAGCSSCQSRCSPRLRPKHSPHRPHVGRQWNTTRCNDMMFIKNLVTQNDEWYLWNINHEVLVQSEKLLYCSGHINYIYSYSTN